MSNAVTRPRGARARRAGPAAVFGSVSIRLIDALVEGAVLVERGRLSMNRAAESITGYSRHDLRTPDAWLLALHGDRAEAMRSCYKPGRVGRDADHRHISITRRDRMIRQLTLTTYRLDQTRMLWLLLDETDKESTVRALRRSEEYLRAIVTTAADAIITIDERGVMDTFNRAAERMFGYEAAEAIGQNVRLIMTSPDRDDHDEYIARYRRTAKARIIGTGREVVGRRKDGTTFPLDLSVSEIDRQGRFAGVLRDLSERRALEWRLAESQLEERRYMARELHDEVGGHMTGISLLAQSLHDELARAASPLAPRVQDLVDNIGEAHQRLRGVIRGLMPVDDIPEGLMAALHDLSVRAETLSGVPCAFRCDPPVHVSDVGTAKHLFRIAQEAVNNAVRHARASMIEITLEEVPEHLVVMVTDNGVGPGRLDRTHTGIGLAGMQQRAHLLGGDCSIRPQPQGGTLVRCWVPAAGRVVGPASSSIRSSGRDARHDTGSPRLGDARLTR